MLKQHRVYDIHELTTTLIVLTETERAHEVFRVLS